MYISISIYDPYNKIIGFRVSREERNMSYKDHIGMRVPYSVLRTSKVRDQPDFDPAKMVRLCSRTCGKI